MTDAADKTTPSDDERVLDDAAPVNGEGDVEKLQLELEEAKALAEDNHNNYMRLAAEIDNLRKRTIREVEQARKFGVERFAGELLAAVDSLEMGIDAAAGASAEALLEGKRATLKLLSGAMAKSGVEAIDPEGELFDPNLHEALTMQPSETAEPGSIITVIQKGYQLNGRLLRPARVIVASEPAE
ncbi:MAG: nucleotide exchange factor GrpE [Gammaproteobacteria bacterium]|nr:nucleotide exchange factor GrpE [Gammaproteobacteria bacterium]